MINLRRLSCPAVAFLYILDRYAETRGWNVDDTLLRGTFFRLGIRPPQTAGASGSGTARADFFAKKCGGRLVLRLFRYICRR